MNKRKTVRLAGFVGAVGVSAALVAAASSGTGAYFTDSAGGNLAGTSGHLKITASDTSLNFSGLMPGVDQSKTFKYAATSDSSGPEDVWLVFDTKSCNYGAFTGSSALSYGSNCFGGTTSFTKGGLGRFGHFAVASDQGMGFKSYNLAFNSTGTDTGSDSCNVNGIGNGGSNDSSSSSLYCGVPGAIKIASKIQPGAWHSAQVTFGLSGLAEAQDTTWADVPFTVVATQVGIAPDA